MTRLEEIIAAKRQETARRKELVPQKRLEQSKWFQAPPLSLRKYLVDPARSGIIAEFKRKSPSKGPIAPYANAAAVTRGYMQAGASALSVLTDGPFFGGSQEDLEQARRWNLCPILRKDFTLEAYQVVEARAMGADAILLIAAVLSPAEVKELTSIAHDLGMEVLLEIHGAEELDRLVPEVDAIGVNSRDLHSFKTDPEHALRMLPLLPKTAVLVAESGISGPAWAARLRMAGYQGLLIGEAFMRTADPAATCAAFVRELASLSPILREE